METTIKIKHGNVYTKTYDALKRGKKIVINKGGTGSAKTYDIISLIIGVALYCNNKILTIVSESVPHLEIGVIRIFESVMKRAGIYNPVRWNPTQKRYTFETGSILEFFSVDRISKALGARRYLLFGNEINNLKFEIFDELSRRSEIVLADFNPTAPFWLEKFLEFYDAEVIKSNYLDNPFLPNFEKERIIKRAEKDENFKRIHIDAEYGNYEGLVYPVWLTTDKIPDNSTLICYGMDFGYTNDPSALVAIYKFRSEHYLDELIYQSGLLSQDFIRLMKQQKISQSKPIFADSSDPRFIREIQLGGFNVRGIKKEHLDESIDFCKKYLKFVSQNSTNMIKELRNYMWLRKNDKFINEPIDAYNHALDAMRYGFIGLYGKSGLYMF